MKKLLVLLGPGIGVAVIVIALCMSLDNAFKVNDEEYIREYQQKSFESGQAPPTHEDVRNDLKDMVIMGIMTMLVFTPVVMIGFTRTNSVMRIRTIRRAMRFGYLKNCTLDTREDVLRVALARKIVKDTCPRCDAPIVGAVDADYSCKYCGETIMGVIERK